MSDNLTLLRQITANFNEVKTIIYEHKKITKQLRTVDRKLKTVEAKYKFLTDIIA